ncbi:CDP-alcohol phosphatidyltransferase family protein [candidate division KSB1 bacterium]|nr:CDP-alcohol phosphatidyltransferase family protein [candidate division KSB1 bacterium]MBL7094615.1 CDP-alcohol phosphatidyltransferase family protein [candidate division KSB1 bacterium]
MRKLYTEFKSLLKNIAIEENVDLLIFRPLAFGLVKIIHRFPVTPNQLSLSSIAFGIMSGIMFSFGTKQSFIYAGILYGLTRVLDCSDGMIARLKKNGTPVGRIVDGVVDYINAIAVFVGMGIGLSKSGLSLPVNPWILLIIAGGCMAVHAMVNDFYKNEFEAYALGKKKSNADDKKIFADELNKLRQNKVKPIDQFLIKIYLKYLNIQGSKSPQKFNYDQKRYYQVNRVLMRFWTTIATSTYILMIMISAFLFDPKMFFYFSIIAANIWMLIFWRVQVFFNKKNRS